MTLSSKLWKLNSGNPDNSKKETKINDKIAKFKVLKDQPIGH